jgi:hypothetical protein
MRTVYRYWAGLVFLAVVVQVGAAAFGAFYSAQKLGDQSGSDEAKVISEKTFDHGFAFHSALGYIIFLAALLLLVFALLARLGRRRVLHALGLPVLVLVQILLAWGGAAVAGIGFLHGINALLVLGSSGSLAMQAWWGARRPEPAASPA